MNHGDNQCKLQVVKNIQSEKLKKMASPFRRNKAHKR